MDRPRGPGGHRSRREHFRQAPARVAQGAGGGPQEQLAVGVPAERLGGLTDRLAVEAEGERREPDAVEPCELARRAQPQVAVPRLGEVVNGLTRQAVALGPRLVPVLRNGPAGIERPGRSDAGEDGDRHEQLNAGKSKTARCPTGSGHGRRLPWLGL